MTTLNLGCGTDKRPGNVVNADISPDVEPDVVVDLENTPWPWDTDTFGRIVARHVLEHVEPVPWAEIERVAEPGATFELTYPIGHTRFQDPTHAHYWNVDTARFLAGETEHGHELPISLTLRRMSVEYDFCGSAWLERAYIRLRRALDGPGAWLEQVPGVYGEVNAIYTIQKDGK